MILRFFANNRKYKNIDLTRFHIYNIKKLCISAEPSRKRKVIPITTWFELSQIHIAGEEVIILEKWNGDIHRRAGNDLIDSMKCASLQELLIRILYDETMIAAFVTDGWRVHAKTVLDAIHVNKNNNAPENYFLPKQRFLLYQMTHKSEKVSYTVKAAQDPAQVLEISRQLNAKGVQSPHLDTYEETIALATEYLLDIPEKNYYIFDTAEDMGDWLLTQVLSECKVVRKCPICGKIYFKSRDTCSNACKTIKSERNLFSGKSDLASIYRNTRSMLQSKCRSTRSYVLPKSADSQVELREVCKKAGADLNELLYADDFKQIAAAYKAETKARAKTFADQTTLCLTHPEDMGAKNISDKGYESFKSWLSAFHDQFGCFSYASKHKPYDEDDG